MSGFDALCAMGQRCCEGSAVEVIEHVATCAPVPPREEKPSEPLERRFHVEKELLRGIALKESLRRCGRLWLNSPLDLSEVGDLDF